LQDREDDDAQSHALLGGHLWLAGRTNDARGTVDNIDAIASGESGFDSN